MPIGLFGKYPGRRDFVSVGMRRSILTPLERWLQTGLATSKESVGKRWKEMFLVQPIWNFRLGREIGGVDCLGAMMPSVDGVGRYFPLCIIAYPPDNALGYPLWIDLDIEGWLSAVHEALLSALADGVLPDPDAIVRGIDDPLAVAIRDGEGKPNSQGLRIELGDLARNDIRDTVVQHDLAFSANRQSIWWTEGGSHVPRQVLMAAGMPEPGMFAEMMGRQ